MVDSTATCRVLGVRVLAAGGRVAREDSAQLPQCQRVAPRAQSARRHGAQRIETLADDVDPVLPGQAQPHIGLRAWPWAAEVEPFSTRRCQAAMSGR